jgi:anti-sigma B factor antagonist
MARESNVEITTRKIYDVLVVEMAGRLDSYAAGDAGDQLIGLINGGEKKVLLNLENLEFLTSAGLRIVLRSAKLLQEKRGAFKICAAQGTVLNVLEVSGFNSLIKLYDTEKDAFAAFSAP